MKQTKLLCGAVVLLAILVLTGCPELLGGVGGGGSGGGGETTYTVSYNDNGADSGSPPFDGTSYQQGQMVRVFGNPGNLTKEGATFGGWNTRADGSGTTYTSGQTFVMGVTNIVLYALWVPVETYSVTYNGNGASSGNPPVDDSEYAEDDEVAILGNTGGLAKAGYLFGGWNTAANGSGTLYRAGDRLTMPAADVVLYARWIVDTSGDDGDDGDDGGGGIIEETTGTASIYIGEGAGDAEIIIDSGATTGEGEIVAQ